MKTIKRTVIIREKDLVNIMRESIKCGLWDRIDSEPLTYRGLEHENLIKSLIEPHNKNIPKQAPLPDLYGNMLYREHSLYNKNYLKWELTYDYPAGQIYARSRRDMPREPLVRAFLEKDIL